MKPLLICNPKFIVFFIITTLLFSSSSLAAENYSQTIRGTIMDALTQTPLPGASVVLMGTQPLRGTITDLDGHFRLEHVSIGRIDIQVSMIGYRPVQLNRLLLGSGKELVLEIKLEEQVYQLDDIVVKPVIDKEKPLNEMALVSARTFSVEETERYAGSHGDPARMAANYAGVLSHSDQRNDIIIRGNSPLGLLWRIEGIDIPNPNHFGSMGSTGGPISILNNNLLTNSEFYTGAFPAEFGNALAGAFNLYLRNGNNQAREYTGQIGFNGFELGAEGPLAIGSNASYLVSFRYSTLEVLNALGMSFGTGDAIPQYKDLAFKINIPLNSGRLSVFGLGGTSYIEMFDSKGDSASFGFAGTDVRFDAKMGVAGINHLYFFNNNSRLNTHLAVSGISNKTDIIDLASDIGIPEIDEADHEINYKFSTKFSHRFNVRNFINLGFVYDVTDVLYRGKEYDYKLGSYFYYMNSRGLVGMGRLYGEWQHRFNDALTVNLGLHHSYLFLNNSYSLEPRMATKWEFKPGQSFSLGAGLHSQSQMKAVYFMKELVDTTRLVYKQTNRNTGLSRSLHLVAGYDRMLGEGHRLKAEIYYQWLYHIPVSHRRPQYSALNQGGGFSFQVYHDLVNDGVGENYGIELTLEKFLNKGFYYLITASVFDSRYKGYDNIWRNSAFNNNFVFNMLGGYEWETGKRSRLALDLKLVYAGGNRFLPIDVEKSRLNNGRVYDWEHAYNSRYPDYFRLNSRISLHLNGKSISQEWALELQNITNHKNIFTESWNNKQQEISTSYQMGFMPMVMYKIHF